MTTPKLALPVLVEGQSNGEATHNETIAIMDALFAGRIENDTLTAPPGSPSDGDMHIVAATATGDWAGQETKLAIYYNGGWSFVTPTGGMMMFVHDLKELQCYSSQESAWFPVQPRHSTTEHWTGKYGEGGAKIYAIHFNGLSCPNATTTNHAHGVTGLDVTTRVDIIGSLTNGTTAAAWNTAKAAGGGTFIHVDLDATNIKLTSNQNISGYTADLRIEYSKT
jgi:hypothetical protein